MNSTQRSSPSVWPLAAGWRPARSGAPDRCLRRAACRRPSRPWRSAPIRARFSGRRGGRRCGGRLHLGSGMSIGRRLGLRGGGHGARYDQNSHQNHLLHRRLQAGNRSLPVNYTAEIRPTCSAAERMPFKSRGCRWRQRDPAELAHAAAGHGDAFGDQQRALQHLAAPVAAEPAARGDDAMARDVRPSDTSA